ncbi:hypothetical protein Poly51_20580 [Rubripirellula tenax]|uniref:Uncharacterized protein n=1 Tax=Rubripirellula tenax TaxID=2528015 RepID=A0A5C6FI04_9BACT|nr:hypothetical protein [Rubripirellula tenax]TWU59271.1 hypothetical protein Poly51_20580 [Rubripirellula tenax]
MQIDFERLNRDYDAAVGRVPITSFVEMRLIRSLLAKQSLTHLVDQVRERPNDRRVLDQALATISRLRTLVSRSDVNVLLQLQDRCGDRASGVALAQVLAEHAGPGVGAQHLQRLDPSGRALTLRGPDPLSSMRPSRGSSRLDPVHWLSEPKMGRVQFVDGNPDHVRIRGIELRSGDIGVVELDHPGDGIFDSFLETPGVAPHAMLYVSRRVHCPGESEPLIQPSLLEIYEGGWRTVPLTTGLGPKFSWFSNWVRPSRLPDDVGQKLSNELNTIETLAFDFQSRRIPAGGQFPADWGQPCASCTNLIRIPFERIGIELPYPTTEISPGAVRNLDLIGLPGIGPIHTPTNILHDSRFTHVGIVDNGFPELAYAQAMVVGRPELSHTFGGHFCQRPLKLENLPSWKSIKRWKSARAALLVKIGQSDSLFANLSRLAAGYTADEIPRTASPTAIAFYLRSDMEAGHIMKTIVVPELQRWFGEGGTTKLSELQTSSHFCDLIREGLASSALAKEQWYGT